MKNTVLGQMSTVNFILFGIEAASPTIAAIITVLAFEKATGIRAFFCLNFSPKLKVSAVVASLMIPFAIMFTTKFISCLILEAPFKMICLSPKQLLVIAWAFIAEEIGWRGFLTKKISSSLPAILTPLLVGLVWACWHYHFFLLGSIDVPIFLFIAGCVVDSYLYASLLKISKGNILAAMIFHTASNFFINIFLINPNVNSGSSIPYFTYVIVAAIFAIAVTMFLKYRIHTKLRNS